MEDWISTFVMADVTHFHSESCYVFLVKLIKNVIRMSTREVRLADDYFILIQNREIIGNYRDGNHRVDALHVNTKRDLTLKIL